MTDGDHSDERDPLLVRPFVLRDSGAPDDDESTQTWPASATPPERDEQAPHHSDAPTAILHLPFRRKHAAGAAGSRADRQTGSGSAHRRRLAVLTGAATAVLLGVAAAGYAALRDDVRPSVTTGLPGGPLPAATAPPPTSAATSPPPGTVAPTDGGGPGAGAATATRTGAGTTPTSPAPASATTGSPGVPSGNPSAGEPISLDPAPTGDGTPPVTRAPQGVAPSPPASDRVGVIRGQNGLCLDLNGAIAVDGNHVQVFDCNNSIAQSWTLATDGTLRVQGKCALVVGDNSVEIVSCDGRTPAQWRVSGQRLINASTNTCLTDPSGGRRSGTEVRVTACEGSAGQRWSLP